jgi:uncharacterized protein (DUF4213/DUF364 family)
VSSLKSELMHLCERVARKLDLPLISRVYMPEPHPAADKDTEFGVVVLEDGSAGLYYAWMGVSQSGMNQRYAAREFAGMKPIELAQFFHADNEADRSLGLAAINAISQFTFRKTGYKLNRSGNSMGELNAKPGDHIGMVGYFPSLVKRLRAQKVRVTVIEKKAEFVQNDGLVEVTLDIKALKLCNKILSTSTVLLNDSVDELLTHTKQAETLVMLGPTAGFFPDPFFERGVSSIGGSSIIDADKAISGLNHEEGLGENADKYIIKKNNYPGLEVLLASL